MIALQVLLLLVIGTFFIRRQLRQEVPILPLDLMRIPIFALSVLSSITSFTAQLLAMVSLPFYLQNVAGRNEVETGLLLTPWPVATILTAPVAGRLIEKYHPGLLGGIGMVVYATDSMPVCMYVAVGFALVAAIVSCFRISQPVPMRGR